MADPRTLNVALIVETSVVYGREILRGISRFISVRGRWSVYLDERELNAPPPEWLSEWQGDGVIIRSTNPQLAETLKRRGMPTVDLNDRYGNLGLPRVASDMKAIGRMAAEHLLQRGYRNIAFCGFAAEPWSDDRLAGVIETVTPCGVFQSGWFSLREHAWQEERDAISNWLRHLPRPLGVVACNDVRGYHVLDACRAIGAAVPEEIAVIGVDNSETFCDLCDPSLSSVEPNAEHIGFRAAKLLQRQISGQVVEAEDILLPPYRVAARQSTDSIAITDPIVAKAAQYIRESAHHPIKVDDVQARVGVSRATLERRFRASLGRSPHDEISRIRIKRVQTLLQETSWALAQIAEEAGYEHPEYLSVQFKREVGMTPTEWRVKASQRSV